MRLTDLNPIVTQRSPEGWVQFAFTCPACRKGVVSVRCQLGTEGNGCHGANILPPDWDRLTITPSIADEGLCTRSPCPGWHGFITNGEVLP